MTEKLGENARGAAYLRGLLMILRSRADHPERGDLRALIDTAASDGVGKSPWRVRPGDPGR